MPFCKSDYENWVAQQMVFSLQYVGTSIKGNKLQRANFKQNEKYKYKYFFTKTYFIIAVEMARKRIN